MTEKTNQTGQPPDGDKRQNQGIPYTLRRIQIFDGLILAAIIAVFSSQQETNRKVDQLLAEGKAEEKIEADNPPIRRVQYKLELDAVREHIKAVDGRVTDLEADNRER